MKQPRDSEHVPLMRTLLSVKASRPPTRLTHSLTLTSGGVRPARGHHRELVHHLRAARHCPHRRARPGIRRCFLQGRGVAALPGKSGSHSPRAGPRQP